MDDERIIELYFSRSEDAIAETAKKYGRYCHTVAFRILRSVSEAEECVDDTYMRAWGAIPPDRPRKLSAYLARITRNLALDRLKCAGAKKSPRQVRQGARGQAVLNRDGGSRRADRGDFRPCGRRTLRGACPYRGAQSLPRRTSRE